MLICLKPHFSVRLHSKLLALIYFLILTGCQSEKYYSGYIEGEFVQVAPSIAGRILNMAVEEGDWVLDKQLLYVLESDNERYAKLAAQQQAKSTEYQYIDLTKGKRPDEIESLQMQRNQAQEQLDLAQIEYDRQQKLIKIGGTSQEALDQAKTTFDNAKDAVKDFDAQLRLAHLGAREDQIKASKATATASNAELRQAEWRLDQKTVHAPVRARVQQVLYRKGEWVNSGLPVITLLPPTNLKARFYVSELDLGSIKVGQPLAINCDGCKKQISAKITFISSEAEYTPPVIFSREARRKLVYLVEAKIPVDQFEFLHPGQPIDVNIRKQE